MAVPPVNVLDELGLGGDDGNVVVVDTPAPGPQENIFADVGLAGPGGRLRLGPPPTYTQRAGLWLACGVGALIFTVTLVIMWTWMSNTSHGSPFPKFVETQVNSTDLQTNASVVKTLIENHKLLSDTATDQAAKIFESIIIKALLPVFTGILGYIFGTHVAESQSAAPEP